MKKLLRKYHFLALFLSVVFLILPGGYVFACRPAGPDPWFAITLSFDESTLPDGIEIVQIDPVHEPYALINKNPEPFYIVREINSVFLSPAYGNEHRFPDSGLPESYEPRYKVTPNQVYFWGQLNSRDTEGWKPNSGGINNSAKNSVRIDADIYILEGQSSQIYRDNRPAVVDNPEPQNFMILGFYRDSPVKITGLLSYSLNENYDPQRSAKGVEACNKWNETLNSPFWKLLTWVPGLIIFTLLLAVGFLIYKVIKRLKK